MSDYLFLIPILFPIITGALILAFPIKKDKSRNAVTFTISIINMIVTLLLLIFCDGESVVLFSFNESLNISLHVDGLGRFFGGLVSILWPFAQLYAYEYMSKEERRNSFFAFFTMTLGSVLGISFSGDLFTMYIFYELLTLLTFPLVMHEGNKESVKAGRKYLAYMLGGAAFALMGLIVLLNFSGTVNFMKGGFLAGVAPENRELLIVVFVVMFMGFGVKAALMPFGKWLISAAVAPTPVTALLHAVAVVKAGAFACIRLIYFCFGAEYLHGSFGQYIALALTIFTILYGSCMAVKETHIKKRLAYSTISNLSYVLFGACLMTDDGLYGSLSHFLVHAVSKIALFFCIGSIIYVTGKTSIYDINGLGHRMKKIFACFTLCALSLIGIPPFSGFMSKYNLLEAAINEGSPLAIVGMLAILVSAVLTAIYLLTIFMRGYFPAENKLSDGIDTAHDPSFRMLTPIMVFTVVVFVLGLLWNNVSSLIML